MSEKMGIDKVVLYLTTRFKKQSGEPGFWTKPDGTKIPVDMGSARDWWLSCAVPELMDLRREELEQEIAMKINSANLESLFVKLDARLAQREVQG